MNNYSGCACWSRRDSGIGIHEIKVLRHGVHLVIKLARESDYFINEGLPPDCDFGQEDFLIAYFRQVPVKTNGLGVARWCNKPEVELCLSPNRGMKRGTIGSTLNERHTWTVSPHE